RGGQHSRALPFYGRRAGPSARTICEPHLQSLNGPSASICVNLRINTHPVAEPGWPVGPTKHRLIEMIVRPANQGVALGWAVWRLVEAYIGRSYCCRCVGS